MRLIILEGARGTGKSTIGRTLRETVNYTTLVNFTGFKDTGEEGLIKVSNYYLTWLHMLNDLKSKGEYTMICDRLFFSEMVYSTLYKDYDFSSYYKSLCHMLVDGNVVIDLFFFTISNIEELQQRLVRDKVAFANVMENVEESIRQQEEYNRVISAFADQYANENIRIHHIDTSGLNEAQVRDKVLSIIDNDELYKNKKERLSV